MRTNSLIFNYSVTPEIQDVPVILSKRPEIGTNSLLFSNSKNSGFWLLFQAKKREMQANSLIFSNPKIQDFPFIQTKGQEVLNDNPMN